MNLKAERLNVRIHNDIRRVLLRPFYPTTETRSGKICRRVLSLSENDVDSLWNQIFLQFNSRHRNYQSFVRRRFEQVRKYIPDEPEMSENRKLLMGAYFTLEYSPEAAALFNPSMIWYPEQNNGTAEEKRFIISLRATGEGHISSLAFRSGIMKDSSEIQMDDISRFVSTPEVITTNDGYEAVFSDEIPLSERVLFPAVPEESNGIEDARFVNFTDENKDGICYATYTAYDGKSIHSMLLETKDFLHFRIHRLQGDAVQNKGLAFFPRKIHGKFVTLSRQDNENNYLMFSDSIYQWDQKQLLMEPVFPWEFFQIGNCGCPIETEYGWLVLAHGVGAMRTYVISAFLLDLDDPTRVVGRLRTPLLAGDESEREGYVPNVVYTCGGQLFGSRLVFPYAMSDYATGFATVDINELLNGMK